MLTNFIAFGNAKRGLVACFLGILTAVSAGFGSTDAQGQTEAPIRGMVRALKQSSIATDLPARVKRLLVREAQAFRNGDLLLEFDCERLEAELAAAEATMREMQLSLDSNLYLDQKGAIGRFDVEVSRARADKAVAEANSLRSRIKQCKVIAPFDGRVVDLAINDHEYPVQGRPFMTLVNEANFEIDLIVPSYYLRHIRPGDAFKYTIDETGHEYDAKVLRVGAAVDPVSQTVKVIAVFSGPVDDVLAGMSGAAKLQTREPSQ
jgi:RND family efflux transporter MFP subunit